MRRASLLTPIALAITLIPCAAPAQSAAAPLAESMVANVARITMGGRSGFGFIVGLAPRQLIVATALHTVDGAEGEPRICFPHNGESCANGSIVYIADAVGTLPALDLAFLSVPYPDGLQWRPDVAGKQPRVGNTVWSIGRGREWYVPPQPGHIHRVEAERGLLEYVGLSVAEGVSGAPIVSEEGIVAMHVEASGEANVARGVAVSAIRQRLVDYARIPWILVPPAECEEWESQRTVLGGRVIVMHFDASKSNAAMEAAARLHCLGARVTLSPVWDAASWPGNRVIYPSGGVRLLRSIQAVLGSIGRFDGRLGEPAGNVDLWVR